MLSKIFSIFDFYEINFFNTLAANLSPVIHLTTYVFLHKESQDLVCSQRVKDSLKIICVTVTSSSWK